MKKALAISIGLAFALACGDSATGPGGDALVPAFKPGPGPADITVVPSGDMTGATDADAIESALTTAAPGDVIELAVGTFYIDRTLLAPTAFNGTLRGAGKNKTTIMGVGTAAAPFGNALINFPGGPVPINGSSFFFFPQPSGNLAVSDLAVSLPDAFVTETGGPPWFSTDLIAFFSVQMGSDDCSTRFERLRLQGTESGTPDLFRSHQPYYGVAVLGLRDAFPSLSSGGDHVVRNSEISKVGLEATSHVAFKDASIKIKNNTFTDVKQIITRFLDGAEVSITGNTMNTFSLGAIAVTQEGLALPGDVSDVVIRGNDVTVRGFAGIDIGGIPEATRPDFNLLIEKNKIFQAGPGPFGVTNLAGILLDPGQDGAMVRNNIIRGDGSFGILAFGVNNSVFMGNNLQGFTPVVADYVLFDSNDNTIVGKGNATVVDGGSGNIITGLTKVPGKSIGERIKAAQEKRREILEAVGGSYWP